VTEEGVPPQRKISEKSVALFFGFKINSFCAASCLLKILQLCREIQERERARERDLLACWKFSNFVERDAREREREIHLLAG
jgi:hypothetical protein